MKVKSGIEAGLSFGAVESYMIQERASLLKSPGRTRLGQGGGGQGSWDVGMSHGTVRPAEVWACPHSSIIPTHPIHPGEGAVGRMSARVQLQFLLSTLNSPPEKG